MSTPRPPALVALVTPFSRAGELDLGAHEHNVALLTELGMEGFLLGGSTGEGPYLEDGERGALIEGARRAAPSAHLMAGIAAETVRAAVRQLGESADAGADSALVLTPTTMSRGDTAAVLRFYLAAADASPLPVLLYSVPKWTGYELPELAVHRLAEVPGIIGMKDSGGDIRRIARLIAGLSDDFEMYNGASAVLGQAVWSGATGGITASANYAPELMRDVVTGGRLEDQRRLAALAAKVEAHGIPGVKAAAEARGLRAGYPRAPLERLASAARGRIATEIAES